MMTNLKPTPWGVDFAEPAGRVAEKLRKLTAIQRKLIDAHNAELPGEKRFRGFYNPRFHAVGHAIAVLRRTLPIPGYDDAGMPLPRYDKVAAGKTREFAADYKAVDLARTFRGEAKAAEPPDPYEDFSTYTETDPNGDFTIGNGGATDSKITVDGMRRDMDAYIYKDYGADHFSDPFTHKFQTRCSAADDRAVGGLWTLSNSVDSTAGLENTEAVGAFWWGSGDKIYLRDYEDQFDDQEGYNGSTGVDYYCTADRSGTSCQLYIRTGSHSGSLQATLSVTLLSDSTYRYCMAVLSLNSGSYESAESSYYIQDLDLQEAAAGNPWYYYAQQRAVA